MNPSCRMRSTFVMGGGIILIGVLLLLGQYGVISNHWFNLWAITAFLLGLFQLIQTQTWGGRVWGVFLCGLGVVLELNSLGPQFHLARLWPVFIIAAGLAVLVNALERPNPNAASTSPHLSLLSCMGGGEYRISAKNFRGGTATAIMGGFDIDLRNADIEGSTAFITVNAFLGGGVIRIPEAWGVQMRGSSVMGGNSLKIRETGPVEKTLIVEGISMLGGFEVRN